MVDFSGYKPRGHYAGDPAMERYFRAATWFSRLELNLVSRSSRSSGPKLDPSETPREALVALGLADLAERAGSLGDVATLDGAWAALAGRREDVSIADLVALRKRAGVASLRAPSAPEALRDAIGADFRRTARIHFAPDGVTELPVIATFLGPRIVADTVASRPIAHDEVQGRFEIGVADMDLPGNFVDPKTGESRVEAMRIRVGDWQRVVEMLGKYGGSAGFDPEHVGP